jgi:hypothetical protein
MVKVALRLGAIVGLLLLALPAGAVDQNLPVFRPGSIGQNSGVVGNTGTGTVTDASTVTTQGAVKSYNGTVNNGVSSMIVQDSHTGALSGTERYGMWVGSTTPGTGDGSVAASTYAIGAIQIKTNWQSGATAGEVGGINITVRGGGIDQNSNGDTSGILLNIVGSQPHNYIVTQEAEVEYIHNGSPIASDSLGMHIAIGYMKPSTGGTGGFLAGASFGDDGIAYLVTNDAETNPAGSTAGSWDYAFKVVYDNGAVGYDAFHVTGVGDVLLANSSGTHMVELNHTGNGIVVTTGGVQLNTAANIPIYATSSGANNNNFILDNLGGGNQVQIIFRDAGSPKWTLGKQTDNSFFMYDIAQSTNFLSVTTGGNLTLGESGGKTITLGSLVATGSVAGSLCATSGGQIVYKAGVNCF